MRHVIVLILGLSLVGCSVNSNVIDGQQWDNMTAKDSDAALDRALKELVAMPGGPPGVIAVVQRGKQRKVHTFGVADQKNARPMEVDDHMRIASTAKAFSGAVALSLVSKGVLSLDDRRAEERAVCAALAGQVIGE